MIVKYKIKKDSEGYKIKRIVISFCDSIKYEGYILQEEKEFMPCVGYIRFTKYFKTKKEAKKYIKEL